MFRKGNILKQFQVRQSGLNSMGRNGVGEFCIGSKQYGFGCSTTGRGNFVVRDATPEQQGH